MSKLYLLISIWGCILVFSNENCLNNGIYNESNSMCTCPEQFVGRDCSIQALKLQKTGIKAKVEEKFSYIYLKTQARKSTQVAVTFCVESLSTELDVLIFVQQQNVNGQISKIPISAHQAIQIRFKFPRRCVMLQNLSPLILVKKLDGEEPKLILGFRKIIKNNQIDPNVDYLTIAYQINQTTSNSFYQYLFLALLITFMLCICVLISEKIRMFRSIRRLRQTRRIPRPFQARISQINELMPVEKFKNISSVTTSSSDQKLSCSICLFQFEQKCKVRVTPCCHMYHQSCLDSWLETHNTCPICRLEFGGDDEAQDIVNTIRSRNEMRQRIF